MLFIKDSILAIDVNKDQRPILYKKSSKHRITFNE